MTPRVILESPYAGQIGRNIAYARRALRDSLILGEAPIASHLLYTQVGILDDNKPSERGLGIRSFYARHNFADYMVVYYDYGFSNGMLDSMAVFKKTGKPIAYRMIGNV